MPPAASSRAQAAAALHKWLEAGGPFSPSKRGRDAPPLVSLGAVELAGDDDNLTLRATSDIPPGSLVLAVAKSSVLEPRSAAVPPARQQQVAKAAEALRRVAGWRTSLADASDAGKLELIVLLSLELLEPSASAWQPYLASLPVAESCAPPSLWRHVCGEAEAARLLSNTSIGADVAQDEADLEALLGADGRSVASLLGVPGTDEAAARAALLRALALCSTRLVGGVGMVPLLDLANGAPAGEHNCTIERTNLAASPTAPEQAASPPDLRVISARLPPPLRSCTRHVGRAQAACVAVVASRRLARGEEVLLSYGPHTAAVFLYKYGWAMGGADTPDAARSPHDLATVAPPGLWEALRPAQRAVLDKYHMPPPHAPLPHAPSCPSFMPWSPSDVAHMYGPRCRSHRAAGCRCSRR